MLEDIIEFFMNDGISFFIVIFVFLILVLVVLSIYGVVLTFIASLKGNFVGQDEWEENRAEYLEEEQKAEDSFRQHIRDMEEEWDDYLIM